LREKERAIRAPGIHSQPIEPLVQEFGAALSCSNMLFKKGDWGSQLLPDMFFKEEDGWRDE